YTRAIEPPARRSTTLAGDDDRAHGSARRGRDAAGGGRGPALARPPAVGRTPGGARGALCDRRPAERRADRGRHRQAAGLGPRIGLPQPRDARAPRARAARPPRAWRRSLRARRARAGVPRLRALRRTARGRPGATERRATSSPRSDRLRRPLPPLPHRRAVRRLHGARSLRDRNDRGLAPIVAAERTIRPWPAPGPCRAPRAA